MARIFLRQIRVSCSARRLWSSISSNYDLAIAELNKEIESIFGEPPSSSSLSTPEEPSTSSLKTKEGLSHVDTAGKANMVDVSTKDDTNRTATASCRVLLGQQAFKLVAANQIAKGDVLITAKIAGIQAAKQTGNLIPLCHNVFLSRVDVNLVLNEEDFSVEIAGEAVTTGKTGMEMEAMTAVAVAGLTVYDMCKAVTKEIRITDVQLEKKTGGKSGGWFRR